MWPRGFSLILLIAICISGATCHSKTEILIKNSVKKLFEDGDIPPIFKKLSNELDLPGIVKKTSTPEDWAAPQKVVFCSMCATLVNRALDIFANPNVSQTVFFEKVIDICIELGLGNDLLCEGLVYQAEPELVYILSNTDTNGNDICGMFFIGYGCKSRKGSRTWEVELPDTVKPEVDLTPYPAVDDVPTIKILHLADIHYDPDYAAGSNAECDETYLCCHNTSSGDRRRGDEAGYWGDYRACDIPQWTVEALLEDAALNHPDIELIFWTGDHVAHNVWGNSRSINLKLIADTFDMIYKYFPNTLVLPGVGNHEGHPVNTFAQPYVTEEDFDISWLYDELSVMWQRWLPEDVGGTVAYGAYYAVTVKPGLRVISINSNYCYAFNWWLIMDSKDVAQNLLFLANELQKAEDFGDKVYVLSHMSPGNGECDYSWSHQFNRIIFRYENTVVGLFHGHTHNDHFEVYFDPEDPQRAYELSFITPSQTTYVGINPGYKIHIAEGDFEGSQYRILDQESYMFDLEEANKDIVNKPVSTLLYSFLDEYELNDMSPQSMATLVEKMNEMGNNLFEKFFVNYYRAGINVFEECDVKCKENMLCRLFISDNSNHEQCDELLK